MTQNKAVKAKRTTAQTVKATHIEVTAAIPSRLLFKSKTISQK